MFSNLFEEEIKILINLDDIHKYPGSRYTYAAIIAEAVADHLDRMDKDLRNMFLSFLCLSKLTVICEVLVPTSQHIEDLSYLNEYFNLNSDFNLNTPN